uniref:Neurotransmitter-gated ion-channel ligand-binding domain-containing protein n=1 Tax=Scylla olivacea TaxID=85551 RepID=A0A0P4WR66_SCYOL
MHAARCHHKFGVVLGVRKWHHLCLVLGRNSTLFRGGEAVPSPSRCAPSEDFPSEELVIGGSLWGGAPFSGLLADVRLYDAALPEGQVRGLAEGREVSRPVFTLDESSLANLSSSAENVEFVTVDIKNLTSETKNYYFYFEEKLNFIHAASLCRNVGGTQVMISETNSEEILNALLKYSGRVGDVAGDSWARLPESLNGKTTNSCPLLRAYQNPSTLQEEDGDCESTASVLCQLPEDHRLRILGLQEEVVLYPIHNSLNIFEDGGNYRLIATDAGVKLESAQNGITLYERVSSSTRQLTGRHKWFLSDKTENNNNNHSKSEVVLTLTACREGQFTCSDGDCVSLEDVCNLVNDCQDATDELLCADLAFLPDTYSKRFSPSQGTEDKALVGLRITLEQVNHVELTENLLKVVLRLDVMWRDPRILFKYLQKDTAVMLPEEIVQEMWLPCIDLVTAAPDYRDSADFPNMKDKIVTATARTDGFGTILGHTEGKFFPSCW